MTRLVRLVPGWVWLVVLTVIAAAVAWQYHRVVVLERDAATAQLQVSQAEVAVLDSALRWRRDYSRRLEGALAQREQALTEAREEIRAHLDELARLEREHAEVREWLDRDLPGPVAEWLQQLADQDDRRAGAGDARDSGQAD
ncbi:hypothetical protein [Billgrantia bachuensis]|uniref:Uncharacterized protein n=1 Tax=Billgrantia bachuensis TaxID=2717286 RepID=A0ABX0PSR9_9GAMM|nr:hypothetical protein [Halomonas bachuensis]NIC05252.1 hypothetical protein [Halomonas bachuensis]